MQPPDGTQPPFTNCYRISIDDYTRVCLIRPFCYYWIWFFLHHQLSEDATVSPTKLLSVVVVDYDRCTRRENQLPAPTTLTWKVAVFLLRWTWAFHFLLFHLNSLIKVFFLWWWRPWSDSHCSSNNNNNRTAYIALLRPTLRSTPRCGCRFVRAIVYMLNCVLPAE